MKKLDPISENEMIAVFLKTEIKSERWSNDILKLLDQDRVERKMIDYPNLLNDDENRYRKELLGAFRGYNKNRLLFEDFPEDIKWFRVLLSKDDIGEVKYMRYSYWNELSKQTRLPRVAAGEIKSGHEVFGVSNDGFWEAVVVMQNGVGFPEMILVAKNQSSDLVMLEGHKRITAFFLAPELIPNELEVIVGYSENMKAWGGY